MRGFNLLALLHGIAILAFLYECVINRIRHIRHPDARIREWHHGYLGDIMFALGLVLVNVAPWTWFDVLLSTLLVLPGFAFRVDDSWQHWKHTHGEPLYTSPLKRVYTKYLWPLPIIQKLTRWLDRRMGPSEKAHWI